MLDWNIAMQTIYSSSQIRLNSLGRSLNAIQDAQRQLRGFSAMPATQVALASRIHLCNTLLSEISGIRRRLARLKNKHAAGLRVELDRNAGDAISSSDVSGAAHVPLMPASTIVTGTIVGPIMAVACVAPPQLSCRRRGTQH